MPRRLRRRQFLSAAGLGAAGALFPTIVRGQSDGGGELVGRFCYDGPPPARRKLVVDKDVDCCGKFDIRDESLLVGPDAGLANVFVYVRSKVAPTARALEVEPAPRVTLDNRDCIFQPHCLTIWYPRQEFFTVNSDPVAQNIAFEPLGDVPCNVVLPVAGSATYRFGRRQPAPVAIKCNYHPWESGYILPRDNPYAAISAADGTFRIPRLPAGELEFQVWHERIGYLDTPAWPKGRFRLQIKPGTNDLGTVRLAAAVFQQ